MSQSILENIKVNSGVPLEDDLVVEVPKKKEPIQEAPSYIDLILSESSVKKVFCPSPNHTTGSVKDSIDTGFAIDDSLALKPCEEEPFALPLYKENFLGEFKTEEEQRMARHSLGLFDDKDVVAMSLLTTNDKVEDSKTLSEIMIQVLEKGKKPVAVLTVDKAVYVKLDNKYSTLDAVLNQYTTLIERANTRIDSILNKSYSGNAIKTLGDLLAFFTGVSNTTTFLEIVDDYLQFENKGEIQQIKWQI